MDGSMKNEDVKDNFVRLMSSYSRPIFGFILMLSGNRTDAEDIFQNTSVALWRKFESFQQGTNFKAWSFNVAYFEVMEHRRKKSRLHRLLNDDAFEALANDAVLDAEVDSREDALETCLEKLSRTDRKLIERRYFNSQSPKQIAEQTSKSIYAVYRALARIHNALLSCVQKSLAGGVE